MINYGSALHLFQSPSQGPSGALIGHTTSSTEAVLQKASNSSPVFYYAFLSCNNDTQTIKL